MRTPYRLTMSVLALALLTTGCGDDALAPQFEPEVVVTPNVSFSFQATGLEDISDVVNYTWSVASGSVIIHPSTATTGGTITLNIRDAAGTVIYNGTVPPSGDITPSNGVAGTWAIRLTLTDYSGTINFAVQMQ